MGIVGGFDVHRAQITFEYLDAEDGQVRRGQIRPATREDLRAWRSGASPTSPSPWRPPPGGGS